MDALANALSRLARQERRQSIEFDSPSMSKSDDQFVSDLHIGDEDSAPVEAIERGKFPVAAAAAILALMGLVAFICFYCINSLFPGGADQNRKSKPSHAAAKAVENASSKKSAIDSSLGSVKLQVDEEELAQDKNDPYALEEQKRIDRVFAFNKEVESKCTHAIDLGDQSSEVYRLRGIARRNLGKQDLALKDLDKIGRAS